MDVAERQLRIFRLRCAALKMTVGLVGAGGAWILQRHSPVPKGGAPGDIGILAAGTPPAQPAGRPALLACAICG